MAVSKQFRDFIVDQMSGLDGVDTRAMFGGLGLFRDGLMFALVTGEEQLYFKVDDDNRAAFEAEGMGAFVYNGKTRQVTMSYQQAPERLYDEPEEMTKWAKEAVSAALRADRKKKKSPKK